MTVREWHRGEERKGVDEKTMCVCACVCWEGKRHFGKEERIREWGERVTIIKVAEV